MEYLTKELVKLENKCEDLESMIVIMIQNIWIIGVLVDDSLLVSTVNVSKLLKEAFTLWKESLVDRAHRALIPKPTHFKSIQ